tara:strand:+ start:40 stop:672 length:633 start_codon:yes stop_codon:yes gene_type:complete
MAYKGYGIDWDELQKIGTKAAVYLRQQRAQAKLAEQAEAYNKAVNSVSKGKDFWQTQKPLQGASQVRTSSNLAAARVDKALMNPSFTNEALKVQSLVGADFTKNLASSMKVTPDMFTSAPQLGATQAAQSQALAQSFTNPQNVSAITGGTGSGAGAAAAGMGALGWGALAMQAIAALNIGAKKGKPAIGSGANKTVALGTGLIDEEMYGV